MKNPLNPAGPPSAAARRSSYHNVLATFIVLAFLFVCVLVIGILAADTTPVEAAAAGILGAVLGYWANNLTQVVSYYFGSAAPPQHSEMHRATDAPELPKPAIEKEVTL